MDRFYLVKEYILYHLYKRRLTSAEFCKLCEIDCDMFGKIISGDIQQHVLESCVSLSEGSEEELALKKISKYISVPITHLVVDLDDPLNKPLLDDFIKEWEGRLPKKSIFTFD